LLVTLVVFLLVAFQTASFGQKIGVVLLAPLGGAIYWYVFLFLLLISEYLGTFGIVLSRVLVLYFFLFSRFVAERPPLVSLPLTKR
jgi:hypothetical protein